MKDKVLQRKMFRQKALKKYGGDMLPKFNTSGLMEGEEKLGPLDSGIARIRKVFPNFLNVTGEDKNTEPSIGQPYDSKQAMLLAVAGRLLQADQRPGESMFSGVGRGVGKAITEDFPIIKKLSLEDRAARTKTSTSVNKTKVWDTEAGEFQEISFADLDADRKSSELFGTDQRFIVGEKETFYGRTDDNPYVKKNEPFQMNPGAQRDLRKKLGPEEFLRIFKSEIYKPSLAELESSKLKIQDDKVWGKTDKIYKDSFSGMDSFRKTKDKALVLLNSGAESSGLITGLKNVFKAGVVEVDKVVRLFDEEKYRQGQKDKSELLQILQTGTSEEIMNYQVGNAYVFKGVKSEIFKRFMNETGKNKELAALMVDLAYTKAKAREPGGRFSTTDISLAMETVGAISSPLDAMKVLNNAYETTLNDGFSGYVQHINNDPRERFKDVAPDGVNLDRFDLLYKSKFYGKRFKGYETLINDYLRFNNYEFKVNEQKETGDDGGSSGTDF